MRHLVSGGWYHRNSVGERLSEPCQAGDGVLSVLQDNILVHLLGMEGLWHALAGTVATVSYLSGVANPYCNLPVYGLIGESFECK